MVNKYPLRAYEEVDKHSFRPTHYPQSKLNVLNLSFSNYKGKVYFDVYLPPEMNMTTSFWKSIKGTVTINKTLPKVFT